MMANGAETYCLYLRAFNLLVVDGVLQKTKADKYKARNPNITSSLLWSATPYSHTLLVMCYLWSL